MTNKLYVSNVPLDATEDTLRAHFATCGGVAQVELLYARQSGAPRGLAFVTMTAPFFTAAAMRLDGVAFGASKLRVSDAPIRAGRPAPPPVQIVLQFRDHASMVYDLDCEGNPLTLRVAAGTDAADTFHVEARSASGAGPVVGVGDGSTRREALAEAMRAWNVASTGGHGRTVDGDAVARAMIDVRAI